MTEPLKFSGSVTGAAALRVRLGRISAERVARVRGAVRVAGLMVEARVKTTTLNGAVLRRRTGTLARSINTRFSETPTSFTAAVGTNVWYGRMWELYGHKGFTVRPTVRKALRWQDAGGGGAVHFARVVHVPAQAKRPFLKPALVDLAPTIRRTILDAARGA